MDITLLGTGAADGWPNPFCRCASCAQARDADEHRSPASALVDGCLLLDAGPSLGPQAAASGVDLAAVGTILLTHAHHDHLDPSFLLYRSWVSDAPLVVAGPRPAIERCRPWLAPDQTVVEFVELTAGDVATWGRHRVTALPARHEAFGEALLYAVESPGGALLYATDTGPWVDRAATLLAGRRFDLVVMEETFGDRDDLGDEHLGLATFAAEVDRLRLRGCVEDATQVVATHLSHHNPPLPLLRRRLRDIGADVVPDGTTLWS